MWRNIILSLMWCNDRLLLITDVTTVSTTLSKHKFVSQHKLMHFPVFCTWSGCARCLNLTQRWVNLRVFSWGMLTSQQATLTPEHLDPQRSCTPRWRGWLGVCRHWDHTCRTEPANISPSVTLSPSTHKQKSHVCSHWDHTCHMEPANISPSVTPLPSTHKQKSHVCSHWDHTCRMEPANISPSVTPLPSTHAQKSQLTL